MNSFINSFFLPDTCLQGSEVPSHILWNNEKAVKINVYYPFKLIKLKELYNVDKKGFKITEGLIRIFEFEKNGYVGFVFETKVYDESSIEIPIKIELENNEGSKEIIEKKVLVFRQNIVALKKPKKIFINEFKGKISFKDKIHLKNEGKGTAIVKLEILKDSTVLIKMPSDIEGFVDEFTTRFIERANDINATYPEYSNTLGKFEEFIVAASNGSLTINEETALSLEEMGENLNIACKENEDFAIAVVDSIISSYLASVHMITELHGLLEYLKSFTRNKVMLLNAMSVLELRPGTNYLLGQLDVTDLNNNVYEPLKFDIAIESNADSNIMIPLYSIFEWAG